MSDELRDYFDEPIAATYDAGVARQFSAEELDAEVSFLAAQAAGGTMGEGGSPAGRSCAAA